jgi:methyl-accepting chemotaxis protein
MFRKLSLAKRFSVILLLIFLFTLPVMTTTLYYFFRQNAMREVADKAAITMQSMESLRKYVGKELRPMVTRELPGKFIVEGASGFYVLRKVSYNLQEVQPNYIYKQASDNPLAKENRADFYETTLLVEFGRNPKLKELTGIRNDTPEPLYYIARPVVVDRDECMKCHGNVNNAPKEQVERYGAASGYNYAMNSVVGANIIYVPASVPMAIAKRSTIIVAVAFTVLFFLIFIIINILIRRSILHPIERFVRSAEQVSKGKFDNTFDVDTEDELKTLADAFSRLKTSIVMMMERMKKPVK